MSTIDPENAREEVLSIATQMLNGNIDLIEGVRKLCELRHYIPEYNAELFSLFRGVDSETDEYPIGDCREQYNDEYLRKLDEELNKYIKVEKSAILESCKVLITKLQKD